MFLFFLLVDSKDYRILCNMGYRKVLESKNTNIPLQEFIDIAINLIFNHNPDLNITNFFFLLHDRLTEFIFKSKFHNQIDGVAMGSPLVPVLANIFHGFLQI